MASADAEYSSLLQKSTLSNKYRIKALQKVAETNEHRAQEIVQSIKEKIPTETDENKEILLSLLRVLASHDSYSFAEEKEAQKRRLDPQENQTKKQKIEENPKIRFLPYPPEYFLLKLVSKALYTDSYIYYTEGKDKKSTETELEPQLTREYLVVPHLEQAVKLLYTAATQCKVCGMRFDSLSLYTVHADMHQKKSQIGKSVEIPMWRAWLLEPTEWTKKEKKISVTLKSTIQEKVPTVPVRGDRDQRCTICGDTFEIIWSDENECWAFNGALVIRKTPRQISHKKCVS